VADLLTDETADTVGTGASHSGACTVYVYGTWDGANVTIQVSPDDTNYVNADLFGADTFRGNGAVGIDGKGTYYVRAVLTDAGSSTSISAETTQ
jgi:hypothetical protein